MITVFHGDDTERSRTAYHLLVSQAAKGKDVRRLEGREVDASVLTQALESSSLFGGDVLVVIDNLFTKVGKKQKLASQYADILRQRPEGTEVIVWEGKELGATIQKALGSKARFEIFKTPVVIFQFLDSLAMGNAAALLGLYEQVTRTHASELVFAMITKRIRQLCMLKDGITPDGLQGWQAGRLTNQTKAFTMEQLLSMHKKLVEIEYSLKTGSSPFTLAQMTQQWLVALT